MCLLVYKCLSEKKKGGGGEENDNPLPSLPFFSNLETDNIVI